jgi:cation:H+ antiporter
LSEKVIGLTLVAVGTSLPELATTLSAARQKRSDLVVGNIVGSNIYNLLFIWGLTLTIAPAKLPAGGAVDVLVMLLFALVLLPMALTQHRFGRMEAGVLLTGYVAYVGGLAVF